MSFILEALIQAQLERQSRGVPGLYTVQTLPPRRPPIRRRGRALAGGLAAAGLAGILVLAWMQPWLPAPEEVAPPMVAGAIDLPPAQAAPAKVKLAGGELASPITLPPAVAVLPLPTPALPATALPDSAAEPETVAQAQPPHHRHRRPAHKNKARLASAAEPAPPVGNRLYSIPELPADLQKVAKAISIAGFAHADRPKERMAIINNRALREGEAVSGDLRVERIAGDAVVFNLKGYRFRKGRT